MTPLGTPELTETLLLIQTAYPGDVLFALPLAVALRRAHPSARIIGLTSREGAPVWIGQPCFDEVVVWDKRGRERGLLPMWRVARRLRGMGVGTAIVAHASTASALLARLSDAPRRVGFALGMGRWCHTETVPFPSGTFERRYAGFFERLGLTPPQPTEVFCVPPAARDRIRERLASLVHDPRAQIVVVTFGSKIGTKKWPSERWGALVGRLVRERSAEVVLLGTPSESDEADAIRAHAGQVGHNLTGLSVAESAAVLASASAVVGVDSFGIHLARFLGTRAVGVFGPTDPAALDWRPGQAPAHAEGLSCRPCTSFHAPRVCPLGHHRCMMDLDVERVWRALIALDPS